MTEPNTFENIRQSIKILFVNNVIECTIVERLNRFVVRVEIAGKQHPMHINNTGRLEELLVKGRKAFCFLTESTRKTDGRLFAVTESGMAALIDTQLQMKTFERLVEKGHIPWLKDCSFQKRNPRLGSSVLDYLIKCGHRDIPVEVKSAVLREGEFATYPDCPTTRGQRHVRELAEYSEKGGIAIIVFMAALPEISAFKPDKKGDPLLCECLRDALTKGVQVKALSLFFDPRDHFIYLSNPDLPVVVNDAK